MRFNKPAWPTVHFSEEIFVRCPDCDELGLVKTKLGKFIIPVPVNYQTQFHCFSCGSTKDNNQQWHGYFLPMVNRGCGFCGSHLNYIGTPTKEPFSTAEISCPVCRQAKEYELCWYRYKEDQSIDPFFGLKLWLQTNIKSNTLWVYNLDHLEYLREYVAAKLRDDNSRHKYSLISNLPQWITSAKNRELIIKKLDRMEANLQKKIAYIKG